MQDAQPNLQRSFIGLIALVSGIAGFGFACVPDTFIIGWILLFAALVLGIVGAFLSGKTKGTSIAAIVVSIVGTIAGAIVFFSIFANSVVDGLP